MAGAALGARYDFFVSSAAFSAAKDNFAWQAQHLKHVVISCRKTCNRNVLRAFEKAKIDCSLSARRTD